MRGGVRLALADPRFGPLISTCTPVMPSTLAYSADILTFPVESTGLG
jgi:hypothetical protein